MPAIPCSTSGRSRSSWRPDFESAGPSRHTEMIARMIQLKSDGGSCPLTQRIIAEFLAGGRLPGHIERVQATYRQNRDAMVAAVRRELPDARSRFPRVATTCG